MELNGFAATENQIKIARFGDALPVVDQAPPQRKIIEESWPFTVKIVRNETELEKAVSIRHAAYGRHIPQVAALLERPEAADGEPGSVVLLAESKFDGSPLGTMRIQTNRYSKLALEESLELPSWLRDKSQAEATRLGVIGNRMGRTVRMALFKAYYLYCVMEDIQWMIITARSPLDRLYEGLLFKDVIPGAGYIPMHHVGNIPHRVLAFNVERAPLTWSEDSHPLYSYIVYYSHPDIDLSGAGGMKGADTSYRLPASAN